MSAVTTGGREAGVGLPARSVPVPPMPTRAWWAYSASLPGVLWVLLWCGITSNPVVWESEPATLLQYVHYVRALGPLLAGALALLALLARAAHGLDGPTALPRALRPWMFYGILALLASSSSPRPGFASYWALSYLACLLVAWFYLQSHSWEERLARARSLNYLGWLVAAVVFLSLLYVSRNVLFVEGPSGLSGYGISNRVRTVGGVTMVRATGLARFAALPALFGFVLAWRARGWARVLWGGLSLASAVIVFLMQSRGASLALLGGIGFSMLLMGPRARQVGVLVLVLLSILFFSGLDFGVDTQRAVEHLNREGRRGRVEVTSGRTRDWGIALDHIRTSPFFGWGPQADRLFFRFHVHNTYLYAWLAAGLFGLIALVLGLWRAWQDLIRAARGRAVRVLGQQTTMIQMGCILAFFTLRGIPEVSGAMYGIDLLIMIPAIAWLDTLSNIEPDRGADAP